MRSRGVNDYGIRIVYHRYRFPCRRIGKTEKSNVCAIDRISSGFFVLSVSLGDRDHFNIGSAAETFVNAKARRSGFAVNKNFFHRLSFLRLCP